jgi:hypothetical protein
MEMGRHAGDGEMGGWGDEENKRKASTSFEKGGEKFEGENLK